MFNMTTLTCHVCNYTSTTKSNFRNHIYSMRHHKNVQRAQMQEHSDDLHRSDLNTIDTGYGKGHGRKRHKNKEESSAYLVDYTQPSSTQNQNDNDTLVLDTDTATYILPHTLITHPPVADDIYDEIAYTYAYTYTCTQLSAALTTACIGTAILLYTYIR